RKFPSIDTGPPWRRAAFALTSRTRAYERRGFIARECAPPHTAPTDRRAIPRGPQRMGFVPVIDSHAYSDCNQEVVVFGAAGRLNMRVTKDRHVSWSSLSVQDEEHAYTDILDVHLLRPHQHNDVHGQKVLIRRANREISLLRQDSDHKTFEVVQTFLTDRSKMIDCMSSSMASEPLLAVVDTGSVQLFDLCSEEAEVKPIDIVPVQMHSATRQRTRAARFLSNSRLVLAGQHLEGRTRAPIEVFSIRPEGLVEESLRATQILEAPESKFFKGRHSANVLYPVGSDNQSNLILSGWTDGIVRLFDLRAGTQPVQEYWDPVDDGQILSLSCVGQERFFAGSHQNACLKIFDMRMGACQYSYMTTQAPSPKPKRNINVFLALNVRPAQRTFDPLPAPNPKLPRYRGSIYSLSSPSSGSTSIYAGIENHVVELDFVNSDDLLTDRGHTATHMLDKRPILNLSCYERPRSGKESTDAVLLRKQISWDAYEQGARGNEPGWDDRCRLETTSRWARARR
ncbi:hypothetical protein LTR66_017996, partial [Elasticomyces elasticus]